MSHVDDCKERMDNFLDDFFSGEPAPEVEAEVPEIEQIEEVAVDPAEAVEAPVETETEAEPAPASEPKMVPLSAVQAERQRAKDAIDQLNIARQQIADFQAKQASNSVPDPYDDPQGFGAYQQQLVAQQVQQAITHQNFMQSRERALAAHGQDFINEVAAWASGVAEIDHTFEDRMLAQPDPAAWVIEQKKRSDLLKSFEADPDNYVRQRALELGLAAIEPIEATQPQANKPLGPKSLANAKSRGAASSQPIPVEDAFNDLFNKR